MGLAMWSFGFEFNGSRWGGRAVDREVGHRFNEPMAKVTVEYQVLVLNRQL